MTHHPSACMWSKITAELKCITRFISDESGATAVEYALIAGTISIVAGLQGLEAAESFFVVEFHPFVVICNLPRW